MTTVPVLTQEFPEHNNPLGKARGAVQGYETQLTEEQEGLDGAKRKVDKAEEAVKDAQVGVKDLESQVAALKDSLAGAEYILGIVEDEIAAGKRDADGWEITAEKGSE